MLFTMLISFEDRQYMHYSPLNFNEQLANPLITLTYPTKPLLAYSNVMSLCLKVSISLSVLLCVTGQPYNGCQTNRNGCVVVQGTALSPLVFGAEGGGFRDEMGETLKQARRAVNYIEFNLSIVYVRYVLVYIKMKRLVALNRKLVDSTGQLIRCVHAPVSMYIFQVFCSDFICHSSRYGQSPVSARYSVIQRTADSFAEQLNEEVTERLQQTSQNCKSAIMSF